jgi:hypothetical protein
MEKWGNFVNWWLKPSLFCCMWWINQESDFSRKKAQNFRRRSWSFIDTSWFFIWWWFMVKFQNHIDWQNNVYLQMYPPIYFDSNEISSELNLNDSPQISQFWSSQFINGRCTLKFSISLSMTNRQLQLSQVSWKLADDFCRRIIVIDGLIVCVSTTGHSHSIGTRLWLPSLITFIASESVSENESIPLVVIEHKSKLERIEWKVFQKTGLKFVTVPASVEVLGENCFSSCRSLSSVTFALGSRLSRIEWWAFRETGLVETIVPASVEVLGELCFSYCRSLSSTAFESESKLPKVGCCAFFDVPICPRLPTTKCCMCA